MVKADRTAVLVRFPPDLLDLIEEWAAKNEQMRHQAILDLLRLGLLSVDVDREEMIDRLRSNVLTKVHEIAGRLDEMVGDLDALDSVARSMRKTVSAAMRAAVFERDGEVCSYCDTTAGPFQIDHKVPSSRGGANTFDNLCVACKPCNMSKGDKTLDEWTPPNRKKDITGT